MRTRRAAAGAVLHLVLGLATTRGNRAHGAVSADRPTTWQEDGPCDALSAPAPGWSVCRVRSGMSSYVGGSSASCRYKDDGSHQQVLRILCASAAGTRPVSGSGCLRGS